MKVVRSLVVSLLVLMFISLCATRRILRQTAAVKCGKPNRGSGLIFGGAKFKRGAYPWNVALMDKCKTPPEFFCGGTLVSSSHVVTAAHCIQGKGRANKLSASNVNAIFGAHDLNDNDELGKLVLTPESIQIHEYWNPGKASFDADIAMLIFEKDSIQETMFIQPICLWNEEEHFLSGNGTVSGWGKSRLDSKKFELIPSELEIPIHKNEDCFSKDDELQSLSSKRTICAGAGDGSGICFGDSGGSLVVRVNSTFFFRGIISSTLTNGFGSCDVDTYQIYTDALKYFQWMKNKMKQVVCRIIDTDWTGANFTTCFVDNKQFIDEEGFTIDKNFKKDLKVEKIFVEGNQNINFLPEDVAKKFANLIEYSAYYCALKHINEKNFANLVKLSGLVLHQNKIESIASNAFKDLSELENLSLDDNKLKVFDPKWFQSLTKLKFLNLDHNEIVSLGDNTFKNLINLEKLFLRCYNLTSIPRKLFKYNSQLKIMLLSVAVEEATDDIATDSTF